MSHRPLTTALTVAVLIAGTSQPVSANNPLTNIASEVTQVLNNVQLVLKYRRQGQQLLNQVRRLDHMIDQAVNYNGGTFLENPMGLINQVRDITRQGQSIGYAVANIEEVITQQYKGYEEFVAEEYNREVFVEDYANWTKTTQNSISNALQAAGVLMNSLDDEEAIMQQLEERVTNASTRQQALQVASEVNIVNGRQLTKLRELIATNMQVQSSFFQAQNAAEAARTAARQKYFNPEDQVLPETNNARQWLLP